VKLSFTRIACNSSERKRLYLVLFNTSEKYKIQNKQSGCVHVAEIMEMDDEELYVPDDVLEEASAASYQMLPKKSKLCQKKELEKFTSE
jgi:hypothetical protein